MADTRSEEVAARSLGKGKPVNRSASETMLGAVDTDALMRHAREFARRVKLSGTPEELESFRYLQKCMEEFGYRTTLLSHEAYISLPGSSRVAVEGRQLRSITHSMSAATSADGISADLIYVGEGDEASIQRRDVRERSLSSTALPPRRSPRSPPAPVRWASSISARTSISTKCASRRSGEARPSTHGGSSRPLSFVRSPGTTASRCASDASATNPSASPCTRKSTRAGARRRCWPQNWIQKRSYPDAPFILFSGHHDTWHYGVMDNGAANATMLETARTLARRRAEWRRGLRICFWSGHSHGRYSGSAWYADEYWDELERRCAVHVNVDFDRRHRREHFDQFWRCRRTQSGRR